MKDTRTSAHAPMACTSELLRSNQMMAVTEVGSGAQRLKLVVQLPKYAPGHPTGNQLAVGGTFLALLMLA